MAVSAIWLLLAGRNLAISGDEIFYIANLVERNGLVAPVHGLEYFLAPHNGHLVLGGRLIFKALFELAGTSYFVFRAVEVAGFLICVGLFYALARRKTTPFIALAFSVSLLFLGYAQETLLWPFDLHTVYALAFGLGALLALELRSDRRGDIAACALLILSVLTLEVGLAFVVGAAVSVLLRDDRWRRAWIFLAPLVLYGIWWLWARKFDQEAVTLTNVHLISIDLAGALSAVAGSLFGVNPTGPDVPADVTTITAAGTVLAGFAVAGLALRIKRGNVPQTLWVSLAVVLAYWLTIAIGGRAPDSSRYILVGAVMVLLIAADAIRDVRFSPLATAGFFCVIALAIPANVAKLYDGRAARKSVAAVSGAEYAMLELAKGRVEAGYLPSLDPAVKSAGGSVLVPLNAVEYVRVKEQYGSLAMPLDQVRSQSLRLRRIADASLVGALGIELRPSDPPPDPQSCPSVLEAAPRQPAYFEIEPSGVLFGSRSEQDISVSLSRFGHGGRGVRLGTLHPGEWAAVETPPDSSSVPWRALVGGPVYVCPLR
jgi:hypothetical protein